jgi:hypothetical protein
MFLLSLTATCQVWALSLKAGLYTYKGFAGDGKQRPLVPRSRSSPRLKPSVRLPLCESCVGGDLLRVDGVLYEQNPQSARRNNVSGEQISRWFLLLSENLSASNYPGAAYNSKLPPK